jgi:4-amino-4-deoxy-L-arabinose transferase-like glycosyltransferase
MKLGLLLGCLAFVISAACIAYSAPPGTDEGWFASPAYNLIHHGHMGTSVLDPYGYVLRPKFEGLETHTYWVLPANLVAQTIWYRAFGFGLLQMRFLSITWGVLAIVATWLVVVRVVGDERVAGLAAVLLGFDLIFVHFGAMGRMDMMCLSLGLAAQALYMVWREKYFGWSLFLSHLLTALSGLTHPNGLIPLTGLLILQAAFDWKKIRLKYLALIALPYALCAGAYGIYILQAPAAFSAQIAANNTGGGRYYYLRHPLLAIGEEITRYRIYYGLMAESNPLAWIKGFVPLVLFGGLLLQGIRFRQLNRGQRLLLLCGVAPVVLLTYFNYKNAYYLIAAIPYLAANTACAFFSLWRGGGWRRAMAALAILGLLFVDVTTTAKRSVALRARGVEYAEIVNLLNPLLPSAGPRITAPPEFAFLFGFDRVVEDDTLGFFTGRRTNLVIDTPFTPEEVAEIGRLQPQVAAHRTKVLEGEYETLYHGAIYKVYRAREAERGH